MTRGVKVVGSGIVTLILSLMIFGVGEVSVRLVQLLRDGIPFFDDPRTGAVGPITLDDSLGWRATENYQEQPEENHAREASHAIRPSQNQFGFRLFGDLNSGKPKFLVIGDSLTQAISLLDDKPYYTVLKEILGAEVFAYGVGGYGTLQEFMILDRYVDLIKPDLILWQYCTNDFINNDPALERLSTMNNNGMRRPYWVNQAIVYQLPKDSWVQTREWINLHSRFLYWIISRVDRLRALTSPLTIEKTIDKEGFSHQGFLRSVQLTDDLMGRVRTRVGNVPIMAFNCTTDQPYTEAFKRISAHHDIVFWDDVAEAVQVAQARGEDVIRPDEHWNEKGHRIVGETIATHLKSMPNIMMAGHASEDGIVTSIVH